MNGRIRAGDKLITVQADMSVTMPLILNITRTAEDYPSTSTIHREVMRNLQRTKLMPGCGRMSTPKTNR
jgi:hypothetical protein